MTDNITSNLDFPIRIPAQGQDAEPMVVVPMSTLKALSAGAQAIKGSTVILAFDRYKEEYELEAALNGGKYKCAVEEIWQEVFRPRHKHGYKNIRLNELIENEQTSNIVEEVMDILEELYRSCVNELPAQ